MSGFRRQRRGFTLVEVMVALTIMVMSFSILIDMQATAATQTVEARKISTATWLAQERLTEIRIQVEREGFQQDDVYDKGDFDDFGEDGFNYDFSSLEEYHWETLITEIDLEAVGDVVGSLNDMMGGTEGGGAAGGANPADALGMLGAFLQPEMMTAAMEPFIREVRVRVWWGDDLKEAEELGNQVILTTHLMNPAAQTNFPGAGGAPGGGGGPGNPRGIPGGAPNGGGGNMQGGNNSSTAPPPRRLR